MPPRKNPKISEKFPTKKTITRVIVNKRSKAINTPSTSHYGNRNKTIEITRIVAPGLIKCMINVTVEKVTRNVSKETHTQYVKILFSNGRKTKIFGIAYGVNVQAANEFEEGKAYKIQGNIWVKKKGNKFPNKESTSKFDIFLNQIKSQLNPKCRPQIPKGLKAVIDKLSALKKKQETLTENLKDLTILDGSIYRYPGCPNCTRKIGFPEDGKYPCREPSCSNKSGENPRKICMVIRNLKLRDNSGHEVENIVAFDNVTINLLGKEGCEFKDDTEARDLFHGFIGAKVNVQLEMTKIKNLVDCQDVKFVIKSMSVVSKPESSSSVNIEEPPIGTLLGEAPAQEPFDLSRPTTENASSAWSTEDYCEPYEMKSKPRGLVCIINNDSYPHWEEAVRQGCQKDVEKMKKLFDNLHFEVNVYHNVKSTEFSSTIEFFKTSLKFRKVDCSIVIVMGQGSLYEMEMADGIRKNLFSDLVYQFSENKFQEFIGKPKIFFFQTSQGFVSSENSRDFIQGQDRFPDTLVCFSTLPGHEAAHFKDGKGSLFLHELDLLITKYAKDKNLVDILRMVQLRLREYALKEKPEDRIFQTCFHMEIMFRTFFFYGKASCPQTEIQSSV